MYFFISLSFFLCFFFSFLISRTPAPPNFTFIAAGGLLLVYGLANKMDRLLAQLVKGVDSQKAYTHINTYSIGVEREKVKAYGQSSLA